MSAIYIGALSISLVFRGNPNWGDILIKLGRKAQLIWISPVLTCIKVRKLRKSLKFLNVYSIYLLRQKYIFRTTMELRWNWIILHFASAQGDWFSNWDNSYKSLPWSRQLKTNWESEIKANKPSWITRMYYC